MSYCGLVATWHVMLCHLMCWSCHLVRCAGHVMSLDVLQSTTPVLLQTYSKPTPTLLCTTKYYSSTTLTTKFYSSTTLYYKVLCQYNKVLRQSTILYYKVLLQYYKVLRQYYSSTTKNYSSTIKYYSSTTPYYKVLKYHSVPQSTTEILLRTTKYYSSTTLYYSSTTLTTKYCSSTTPYYKVLQSTTVKPYNKKLFPSCQTLTNFLMGTRAVRNFSSAETLRIHFLILIVWTILPQAAAGISGPCLHQNPIVQR